MFTNNIYPKYIFVHLASLVVFSAQAQTVVDTTLLKCTYNFIRMTDTISKQYNENEPMILEIGASISKYYSQLRKVGDSIYEKDVSDGMFGTEISFNTVNNPKYYRNKLATVIFQNSTNNKMTLQNQIIKRYEYDDELNLQIWSIKSDTARILEYKCQKATTNFRGRNYECWFTNEIPTKHGPWKFFGLPGLILKINDTKNNFIFECTGIEKTKNLITKDINNEIIKTSRSDFERLFKAYKEDPLSFISASLSNIIISMKDENGNEIKMPTSNVKKPYNPMELSKD